VATVYARLHAASVFVWFSLTPCALRLMRPLPYPALTCPTVQAGSLASEGKSLSSDLSSVPWLSKQVRGQVPVGASTA
jgi:hypothetical protein